MSNLVPFNYEDKQVRTISKDGQPWFVAKDVCEILKHTNSRMAISRLDEDEKGVSKVYTHGGEQEMTVAETTVELEKQGIRPITVYNPKTNKDDLKFIKR